MKISQITIFVAAIAIEACVGDIPGSSDGNDAGGGTGSAVGSGNGSGSDADGGNGTGRDGGAGGTSDAPTGDGGFGPDDGGLVVACHNANDCPGTEVCCGRKADNDTSVYKSVSCEATCDGVYVYDHSTFCDPNDPHSCDGVVVNPHCAPSDILPGLFVCVSN